MVKLLKIIGRTLGILLEWILVFLILIAFAIRTSPVQTYIADKFTAFLSQELGTEFSIDKVSIIFIDKVELNGVLIIDQAGDTLVAAGSIYASLDDYDLKKLSFHLDEIEVKNANVNIVQNEDGSYNYGFIQDYFDTGSKKKKKKITLRVDEVNLADSRFSYNDNRKERKNNCLDYFHIAGKKINAHVEDFLMVGMEFSGKVKSVSLLEKSGFTLNDLQTNAKVNSTGIYMADLRIESAGSLIETKKFNMISSGYTDFRSFVDSVKFDAKIDRSTIDLKEGALFAPILSGMTDTIQLSTALYKKVKNLRLANFDLRIKNKTRIKGTFNLPDYRKFDQGFFHETIDYAYIDVNELKKIRLPDASPSHYISMNERINRLSYFEVKDVRLDGFFTQFVIASDIVKTGLGDIRMDNGIMFIQNEKHGSYFFEKSSASSYDVKVEHFNLGALVNDKNLGIVDGIFFLEGEALSISDIHFSSIEGNVNRFDYMDYPYQGISILEGKLEDNIFNGKIDIEDDNLEMTYEGMIDFQGEPHLEFTINLRNAVLDKLHLSEINAELSSFIKIDLRGKNPNNFRGTVHLDELMLSEKGKIVKIPSLDLRITRGPTSDEFKIESEIADATIDGKLDFNHILSDLNLQLGRVFPAFFNGEVVERDPDKINHIDFHINIKNSKDFMSIFYPNLELAPGTTVDGHFYAESSNLFAVVHSQRILYNNMTFEDVNMSQVMTDQSIIADYSLGAFIYKDSIRFDDLFFKGYGQHNQLESSLVWEQNTSTPSSIKWETNIVDREHYLFTLEPSYFYVQERKWDISRESKITLEADTILIKDFILQRDQQFLTLDGILSNDDKHHLSFVVKDFELSEITDFISEVPLEGKINASGYLANPTKNFQFQGDANILQFKTKNQLVGDINVHSEWIKQTKSIALQGDLIYKGNKTFDFIGDYYTELKKNNLDFNLFFDHTDIQFTNAFMNPEVMSDIKGLLNGTLQVSGTPDEPVLEGTVALLAGSAKIDLLGTHFGVDGEISADKDGFYIDGIPVFDEEGNAGLLIGSIYHDNFKDFNFDLLFDLEDDALNKDPLHPWMVLPLDKFLILNSAYTAGDLYYGTGYARGIIDIFGYTDNLEVTVNLETREGTKINIPMYGVGDIEEESFVVFLNKDTTLHLEEPKIDFTGVDLKMNFNVTPAAELKIIFNEDLGDEISARGKGDIGISVNNIGDVTMNGIFTVTEGIYDFAMGPIKEKFYIKEGGSISWTGDPYDAILNLRTYYKVNANIAAATNDQFGSGSGAHQEVLCYLDLTQSLLKPTIGFDLEAPRANEAAKSVITRIKSDPDELNRQFFSLLLWKRFQPLAGSVLADGSAAIDLVTNQINAILAKVSDDYTMNVNMESDHLTGDNTYEFGVSKGFLNDRLILSGSFGVENRKIDDANQSSIIGDVELEYLLNESGTFRVNIFNESNDKTVIQSQVQGSFTQGAGLYYKEDFHTINDFKAIQYFLDIFRKKKNKRYPIKRKRKQVPVPQMGGNQAPLPEESSEPEILP